MTIPKKINPDPVRDSIVEVRYESELPHEVLIGKFYEALKDQYHYVSRSTNPNIEHKQGDHQNLINVNLSNKGLFYNDWIKLELEPNKIVFNYNASKSTEYIGWQKFFPQIHEILNTVFQLEEIEEITRIGVRYTSEFTGADIVPNLNTDFQPKITLPPIKSLTFRANFEDEDFNFTIMVSNELSKKNDAGEDQTVSLMDIDVYYLNKEALNESFESLVGIVDSAHTKQKDLFFNLITQDFLTTLNPEY